MGWRMTELHNVKKIQYISVIVPEVGPPKIGTISNKVPVPCYELGEFLDTYCVFAIEMYCQCSVIGSNQSIDTIYISMT